MVACRWRELTRRQVSTRTAWARSLLRHWGIAALEGVTILGSWFKYMRVLALRPHWLRCSARKQGNRYILPQQRCPSLHGLARLRGTASGSVGAVSLVTAPIVSQSI
jgi:hypothetical protein